MAKCASLVLRKCKHFPSNPPMFAPSRFLCGRMPFDKECSPNTKQYSTDETSPKKLNKAMRAYLERSRQHDEFIKDQLVQYNVGKRHLANMMGEDPETFTQKDIDNAISYLFPSGLYDPMARPMMKPPEEVFPPKKAAEFDESGRPHHFLFYTGKPNYFQLLFEVVSNMKELNDFEDKMIKKHLVPDATQNLNISGTSWVTKLQIERILVEPLSDREYETFLYTMDRLLEHPYSYRMKDFVEKYRIPLLSQKAALEIPKPQYDADGIASVTTKECRRKSATGDVTVRAPGTGKITINKKSLHYFQNMQDKEQVLFPLIFTNMVDSVDVEATVWGGGTSGQSGVVRYGISCGLRSFVSPDMVENMRIAGLLQKDYRVPERKKPGQAKARKKFTWKKR